MDRKTFKRSFTINHTPEWICPTCAKGTLRIKKGTFFKEELRRSRDHSHDAWEPEWISYVYSCMLVCTNDQCKEAVTSVGIGEVEQYYAETPDGDHEIEYEDVFRPRHFQPHLKLIAVAEGCPRTVTKHLDESFSLFFSSPSAALNLVRTAVEGLLTELKVKRFYSKNGKRSFISLHRRIELLPKKLQHVKEHLLAIKWLGNAGSHAHGGTNEISIDDVMDAYELVENVLSEIYRDDKQKLNVLAKKINRKKGSVRKSRKGSIAALLGD